MWKNLVIDRVYNMFWIYHLIWYEAGIFFSIIGWKASRDINLFILDCKYVYILVALEDIWVIGGFE
jgi:hypothetical protein